MEELHFFSAATVDWIFMLKLMCMSMKHFKDPNCIYVYHIMLDTDDITKYNNIKYLETDTFKIDLMNVKLIESKFGEYVLKNKMKMSYAKCLLPYLFPQLDKILYLDVDMLIINPGIENIFKIDINNVYLAACYDIPIQLEKDNDERINCKVQQYFNTGIFLLNIKKFKEDGIDKLLEQDCLKWPENVINVINQQTLFNYRCKENVFWLHPTFNNMIIGALFFNIKYYQTFYKLINWCNIEESINQSIIIHFTNGPKPWTYSQDANIDSILPFRRKSQQILLSYMKLFLND